MEIPEAVPKFLHYCIPIIMASFSHIHILQGESESVTCQCNNISCMAELRQTRLTPRPGSVDLSQAYSCAVITVPYFC